ncbi:MAG: hypothetical protein AABY16_04575, partial [Nanoarchaeota archaeon]
RRIIPDKNDNAGIGEFFIKVNNKEIFVSEYNLAPNPAKRSAVIVIEDLKLNKNRPNFHNHKASLIILQFLLKVRVAADLLPKKETTTDYIQFCFGHFSSLTLICLGQKQRSR